MVFVTLEGVDGSGKTTVSELIKDNLNQKGYEVVLTREPGGDEISEEIRNIILNVKHSNMSLWTETLLYVAGRSQHIESTIIPALKSNKIVICDRFMDSTTVYQGYARGLGVDVVDEIQKTIIGSTIPDLTLFFDISPKDALERIALSKRMQDRLDKEDIDFHNKVYQGYKILISKNSNRIKVINAKQKLNQIAQDCTYFILKALDKKDGII